jgi:hypothetical protein
VYSSPGQESSFHSNCPKPGLFALTCCRTGGRAGLRASGQDRRDRQQRGLAPGARPAIEVTLMMWPEPCARRCGRAARMMRIGPNTSTLNSLITSASDAFIGTLAKLGSAIGSEMSDRGSNSDKHQPDKTRSPDKKRLKSVIARVSLNLHGSKQSATLCQASVVA